jgi:type II secretory ATPase GspE/PulE/Tfp pilus assembly ATPase PilB-like protein
VLRFQREIKSLQHLPEMIHKVSLTDVFTAILATAIKINASDIHVEPEESRVLVRFRIDGVLQDAVTFEREIWKKLAPRIKLLAHLKINVENVPQDGRFSIFIQKEKLDVRVAVLPIANGESVVLRLLYAKSIGIPFEALGIRGQALTDLMREIYRPNGMILTTGPTGSGKTTTLYSMVHRLNSGKIKIVTLEDPIEYKIEGMNQSQVNEKNGYSFAVGLKSILRQDPDVVLVGEIRDFETAETAVNASLTGHLVISTLHTNDASGAIPRLLALGVKNFLLAPALNTVIGQRLVRVLCEHCKKPATLSPEARARVDKVVSEIPAHSKPAIPTSTGHVFYESMGCEECYNSGYKGRIGIFEVLVINENVEKFIVEQRVSEYQMKEIAHTYGMVTMIQDGILKAIDGITSVSEVFRVTQ